MVDVEIVPTDFSSEAENIRGAFFHPARGSKFPGICRFHGIPGSPYQDSRIAQDLAKEGFAVLAFDFRGFRESEGYFSLDGMIKDVSNAITHLIESDLTDRNWVGVYAPSYGGAAAVCAAAHDSRISALCLRAPVYDTLWFAKSPLIPPAVEELLRKDPTQIRGLDNEEIREEILQRMIDDAKKFNPMNEISRISPCPLLIVHGSEDVGIDLAGVKRLFELAGEPKELVVVEGADHNLTNPVTLDITMKTIVSWFKKQKP